MITEAQRAKRATKAGSSDAAAILGFSEYASPYDVWLEKTGKVDGFAGNAATERGTYLEPAILAWAEAKLGVNLLRDVYRERGDLCVNFDALVERPHENDRPIQSVEAKSSTLLEKFGDAGSDVIPEEHLVQVHHGKVIVPTLEMAFVPVLVAGYRLLEFRLYEVKLDQAVADDIGERVQTFWDKYVKSDTPPEGWRPSLDVLKRVKRVPGTIVEISDEIVETWQAKARAAKRANEELEAAQVDVIAAMGEADGARCSLGGVEYFETKRRAYSVAEKTFRQLRFKSKADWL